MWIGDGFIEVKDDVVLEYVVINVLYIGEYNFLVCYEFKVFFFFFKKVMIM